MIRALALAGPTACGKSAFSPALADAANGEIISADSGAVYRGMDIGTAKPPASLRAQVPHHLVDIRAPDEYFNAGMFCRLAAKAAEEINARGKTPLFVGGAMMYFYALARGLHRIPEVSAAVRETVRKEMQSRGAQAMHRRLRETDPRAAQKIPASDSQRIARALEVAMQTKRPLSSFTAAQKPPPEMHISFVVLMPANRARLRSAVAARLEQMWKDGLVAETESVMNQYRLPPQSPPMRMAGYKQAAAFLRGECGEEEMRTRACHATRQLAKRQTTWLRKWQNAAAIIDPFAADAEKQIIAAAKESGIE